MLILHSCVLSQQFQEQVALQGLYQDKPPMPFIPGSEISGIVMEVGAKVKAVKQGDHVSSPQTRMHHDASSRACSLTDL